MFLHTFGRDVLGCGCAAASGHTRDTGSKTGKVGLSLDNRDVINSLICVEGEHNSNVHASVEAIVVSHASKPVCNCKLLPVSALVVTRDYMLLGSSSRLTTWPYKDP